MFRTLESVTFIPERRSFPGGGRDGSVEVGLLPLDALVFALDDFLSKGVLFAQVLAHIKE